MSGDSVAITFRLPKELRKRFTRVCNAGAVNQSKLLRQWIEEYTAEKEKELGISLRDD